MQAVVAHELSKELQLYFDRITAVIRGGGRGRTRNPQLATRYPVP
jgi:hypothetical protein